jgi:nicotinamidase-related amidase
MLDNINSLIARARRAGAVVVFIQHADKRTLVKGSEAWQLHPQLRPVAGDRAIHKCHSSAFRETSLDQMLVKEKVARVVVTGLVTHGCVKKACQDALNMGYEVVLASDGHSSYSKQAPEMIHKWHQKLAEAGVEIVPSHEVAFGRCGLEDA